MLSIIYGSLDLTKQQSSLVLIAIDLDFLCTTFTRLYNYRVSKKRKYEAYPPAPEDKLTGLAIATPAFAIGLWWFAWTVPPRVSHLPWAVSALALIPICFAINEFDCVLGGYLTDKYTNFAFSAFVSLFWCFARLYPPRFRSLLTAYIRTLTRTWQPVYWPRWQLSLASAQWSWFSMENAYRRRAGLPSIVLLSTTGWVWGCPT